MKYNEAHGMEMQKRRGRDRSNGRRRAQQHVHVSMRRKKQRRVNRPAWTSSLTRHRVCGGHQKEAMGPQRFGWYPYQLGPMKLLVDVFAAKGVASRRRVYRWRHS